MCILLTAAPSVGCVHMIAVKVLGYRMAIGEGVVASAGRVTKLAALATDSGNLVRSEHVQAAPEVADRKEINSEGLNCVASQDGDDDDGGSTS